MKPQDIIDYWFENETIQYKLWYTSEPDAEIKQRFEHTIIQAKNKELDEWKEDPIGRLALIILLDQFTRNLFRKSKEAFASDSYALQLCKEGIKIKHNTQLSPIQKIFFYHPLEHSENLQDQELCIDLMSKVGIGGFTKYAIEHRDIIKQFGRFPHRNEVLQRTSTKEEKEYLKNAKGSLGRMCISF